MTKKFYLEYQMATGYAKDDPDEEILNFTTLQEWQSKKSTKMDVCARICQHLLSGDGAPNVEFKGGIPMFPLVKQVSGDLTDQILIYQEFLCLCDLLKQVCF